MLDNSLLRNKDKVCSAIKANLRSPQGDLSPTGFSLLEVMVAVIILGFGLLAIMHLFPIGLKASKISQDTTVASFLAQQKIEGLKNETFTGEGFADVTGDTENYGSITGYEGFKRVTTIQTVESTGPKLKRITVEVFYKPYDGERSVKLVTLRTNYKHKYSKDHPL